MDAQLRDETIAELLAENERLRRSLMRIVETPRRDGILTCHRIAAEALRGGMVEASEQVESLGDPIYYARVISYLHERFHSKCAYCGSTEALQIDHLKPVSRGGSDSVTNLCLACESCNQKKGTQTAVEFGFEELAIMTCGSRLPTAADRRRKEHDRASMDRIRKILESEDI